MQKMDLSLIIIRELFPFRNSRPAVSNGFLTLWVAKLVRGYCFFAIQPRRKRRGILARNNKYIDFGIFYQGKKTYIKSENPAFGGTA
jgi:hypothetical protein